MTASTPILELFSIGKRYGATAALQDASFVLHPGEVCGLLGENGAGKSTLVKILSGVVASGTGTMRLGSAAYRPRSITEGRAAGVATAFQELSLVPTLSVATNLFLPRPPVDVLRLVRGRRLEVEAAQVLAEHDASDIDPGALVGELSLGTRQRVEIIRAMRQRPRVLLLDEPTAALSDREWLFRLLEPLLAQGTAVLYISHKLDEIRRLCLRCVILRNGRKVADAQVAAMSDEAIFNSMAGRSVVETFAARVTAVRATAAPMLRASHLVADGVEDVSFSLAAGEILGVAGLEGHGQSSLFKALVGLNRLRSGTIELGGTPAALRSPRSARRQGVVLVPEERKTEGIFPDLRTLGNVSLPAIGRASPFGLLRAGRERRLVAGVASAVDLPGPFLPRSIAALSGGNQQKAVLARALLAGARCLLLFDPTRGVDVGAKRSIYAVMRRFVQDGGAVLFYSTELDELVHLSDRCLVLYRRRIASELAADRLSQELILSIASGRSEPASAA